MPNCDKVGIIVGGGPAPGINGVISSAVIEAINEGKEVVGIIGGFKSLFDGNSDSAISLDIDMVSRIHTEGGSILRTSRDYPDRAKEKFPVLVETLQKLGIRHLITIGGEGTLFMANWIYKEAGQKFNVIHVPKTIDNDIALPGGVQTFGYETARHVGVEVVKDIMEDARTTGRWYFVTAMGRHAGHLALGIGKASGATITLIAEEFTKPKISINLVADILTCSIIKRLSMQRDHGVAILAEGLSEKFDEQELLKYETLQQDETGRVRLSEIQLGRVLKKIVLQNLSSLGINLTIIDKNIGYELRCADPIPFDVEYTRNLGYSAVRSCLKGLSGCTMVFYEGKLTPIAFAEMFDATSGKSKVRTVNTNSENYEVALKYMIKMTKEDFEDPQRLKHISSFSNLSEEAFKERFSYICDE